MSQLKSVDEAEGAEGPERTDPAFESPSIAGKIRCPYLGIVVATLPKSEAIGETLIGDWVEHAGRQYGAALFDVGEFYGPGDGRTDVVLVIPYRGRHEAISAIADLNGLFYSDQFERGERWDIVGLTDQVAVSPDYRAFCAWWDREMRLR
jgi:hypothetical protein